MATTLKIQTEPVNLAGSHLDWTRILAEAGLEAPGYHDAVKTARAATAEKRERKRLAGEEKRAKRRK